MDVIKGSWLVEYEDGAIVYQTDETSPDFRSDESGVGEVPYRAIEWPRVRRLVLSSQWAESEYFLGAAPEGEMVSLRARTYVRQSTLVAQTADGGEETLPSTRVQCFIVLVSRSGEDVSPRSVTHAFFWFPDGSEHACSLLNCPIVDCYGAGEVHLAHSTLPPTH